MSDDEHRDSFEEAFRRIAEGVSDSFARAERGEFDGLARAIGVDPDQARRWAAEASGWLQEQRTHFEGPAPAPAKSETAPAEPQSLGGLGPDPRDLPTEEQGIALAALQSGRWTIEPGTSVIASVRDGQGPRDALGVVRDLRVRDWLGEDGAVTPAGRHALERWLEAPR